VASRALSLTERPTTTARPDRALRPGGGRPWSCSGCPQDCETGLPRHPLAYDRHPEYVAQDRTAEVAVRRPPRRRQRRGNLNPGLVGVSVACRTAKWLLFLAGRLAPALPLPARPHPFVVMPRTSNRLRRRCGPDAPSVERRHYLPDRGPWRTLAVQLRFGCRRSHIHRCQLLAVMPSSP
jgi:hypothetical protein